MDMDSMERRRGKRSPLLMLMLMLMLTPGTVFMAMDMSMVATTVPMDTMDTEHSGDK